MFRDLPITARELKATPAMLERIYEGAKLGLRGDSLALAAGMLPVELARLKLMDPIAEIAEMKGRADPTGAGGGGGQTPRGIRSPPPIPYPVPYPRAPGRQRCAQSDPPRSPCRLRYPRGTGGTAPTLDSEGY